MDLRIVITTVDYQMNFEVKYREAPTSMAYSSNKQTIALYPLCVEYLDDDDGILYKGGIISKWRSLKQESLKYFVR